MTQLVRQAMEEGAVNLSTAFTGGGYKYEDEMVAMAKVVASYGGYYGTHIGGEGAQIDEELDKALKHRRGDWHCGAHLSHQGARQE